jgi:hypothetical protein
VCGTLTARNAVPSSSRRRMVEDDSPSMRRIQIARGARGRARSRRTPRRRAAPAANGRDPPGRTAPAGHHRSGSMRSRASQETHRLRSRSRRGGVAVRSTCPSRMRARARGQSGETSRGPRRVRRRRERRERRLRTRAPEPGSTRSAPPEARQGRRGPDLFPSCRSRWRSITARAKGDRPGGAPRLSLRLLLFQLCRRLDQPAQNLATDDTQSCALAPSSRPLSEGASVPPKYVGELPSETT